MSSRFVLDELDVYLPPLAPGLVVIIVIIVRGGADARALDTSSVGAIAIAGRVVETGGLSVWIGDVGHGRAVAGRRASGRER